MTTTDLIVTTVSLVSLAILVSVLAYQNAILQRELRQAWQSRDLWRKAAIQIRGNNVTEGDK